MFNKQTTKRQFLYKKSYIDHRLQNDVMKDGVAYIPCKVANMDDIISRFSVKGCESLDSEFEAFVIGYTEFIPSEYPVVLKIIGPEFTPAEKKIISETVASDMDYLLGKTEETRRTRKRRFLGMVIGTIVTGVILGFAKRLIEDVPLEFFFVLFWLFADALVRYLFLEKLDFKEERIRAGRLASLKVEFEVSEEPTDLIA